MTKAKPGAVRGRPSLTAPKARTPKQGIAFPPDMIEEIDSLRGEIGPDRSAVIRALVALGLKTIRRRKALMRK